MTLVIGGAQQVAQDRETVPSRFVSLERAAGPLATALLSLVVAVQSLELWRWRPGLPLATGGDATQALMQVRNLLDGDAFQSTSRLGAPFGLNGGWFATGDQLNFVAIRLLGLLTSDPATAAALFFILTYPSAALAAYWLGRRLDITRSGAVMVGVLFAALPGHQLWFGHLWLAAYWVVPLGFWLAIAVMARHPLLPTPADLRAPGRRRASVRLLCGTMAIALVVGLSDAYYVAFTLIMVAFALVIRRLRDGSFRECTHGLLVMLVIMAACGGTLVAAMARRGGDLVTSDLPAQRSIGESERYAGKLIDLLLPFYEHRAGPLRFLTTAFGYTATPSIEHPALGVVALVGVGGLVVVTIRGLVARRPPHIFAGALGASLLVALAFYTKGGLGSVVALFLTPQIRTWSRFVVLIGLIGLLGVGLWQSRIHRRLHRILLVCTLMTIGVLDQTSPEAAPDFPALTAQKAELTTFDTAVAASMAAGCQVFQLPVTRYPEDIPPGDMQDYDHFLPAFYAPNRIRWSYGAMRGTAAADWQLALPIDDVPQLVDDLRAAGYCAVEIDSDGYTTGHDPVPALTALLGQPIARAEGDHLSAFSLGSRPALGDSTRSDVLQPTLVTMSGSLVQRTSDGRPYQWIGPDTSLTVANMGSADRSINVTFDVSTVRGAAARLTVSRGSSTLAKLSLSGRPQHVDLTVTVPPGRTTITMASDAPVTTIPRQEQVAALRVDDLRATGVGANVATLQQFTARSPISNR